MKKYYSWIVQSNNEVYKICDKTFFENNISAIPTEIRWFFHCENMALGDKINVKIIFEKKEYDGYIISARPNGETRISFGSKLGKEIDKYKGKPCLAKFAWDNGNLNFIMDNSKESLKLLSPTLKNAEGYISILDFIDNYHDEPYESPDSSGLTKSAREKYSQIKEKGSSVTKIVNNFSKKCKNNFSLTKSGKTQWYSSVTPIKIKNYLWLQFKDKKYIDNPISISVFVEIPKGKKKSRYRVCLEYTNKKSNVNIINSYNKYVDLIDENSDLSFVLGSNEKEKVQDLKATYSEIKQQIIDNKKKKIQPSIIVERGDKYTDYESLLLEAIERMVPYYYYVLGEEISLKTGTKKRGVNTILYGPPGTGKTYNIATEIKNIIGCTEDEAKEALSGAATGALCKRIKFVTFHQSYGYEDFIEGIKPVLLDKNGKEIKNPNYAGKTELVYKVKDGIFKEFCNNAKDKDEPYIFVIDEINRGNISKIFGELITLVEEDKRLGGSNPMQVVLPYSKESFGIPSNVYIIGTMNTADRSLALMDTALRRRFDFEEMMPKPSVLSNNKYKDVDLEKLLEVINKRIEYLYDREHTIGHAYLINVDNIEKLNAAFQNKIIPLLQEYFYNDYEKIMMVLNQSDNDTVFIVKNNPTDEIDKLFKNNNSDYFEDKIRYEVVKEINATVDQYKAIYE